MEREKDNRVILDSDRIGRLLFQLSLPAFLGMLANALYNVVGTIFVGRYVGPEGIAALSIVFPIQMLAMGIGQITGIGGASLISRYIGAKDYGRASKVLCNSFIITTLLSLILMIFGFSAPDLWVRLMGASKIVSPYASTYLKIVLVGFFFQIFSLALTGLIRAEGNAKIPMIGMMLGALSNILFSALFVAQFGMGIKGAAYAVLLSQLLSFFYLVNFYTKKQTILQWRYKDFYPEGSILKAIFSIGIASFFMTLANSITAILVNRFLLFYGGDYAVSAFGIINRIVMFAIMPALVIGQGLQPIVGFNYGARRYDRAIKAIKLAIFIASILSTSIFFVLYLLPDFFISIFTTDRRLILLASSATRKMFLALYLVGFVMVGSLIFQSLGKAKESIITSLSRPILFFIPLLFLLPYFLKLEGVWLVFPCADFLTFLLVLILFIPQMKELKKASN